MPPIVPITTSSNTRKFLLLRWPGMHTTPKPVIMNILVPLASPTYIHTRCATHSDRICNCIEDVKIGEHAWSRLPNNRWESVKVTQVANIAASHTYPPNAPVSLPRILERSSFTLASTQPIEETAVTAELTGTDGYVQVLVFRPNTRGDMQSPVALSPKP